MQYYRIADNSLETDDIKLDNLQHSISFLEELSSPNNVSILHLNVQSLRNKLSEIEILLNELSFQFVCMNEQWLHPYEIDLYTPNNYTLLTYFCRDKSIGGDVAISRHPELQQEDKSNTT